MYLGITSQRKADKLREYILKHEDDKCYVKCSACKGKGLEGYHENSINGGFSWNGEFCDKCEGVGYYEYKPKEGMVVCKSCNGCGCNDCNDIGVMDWVDAMRYGVTNWVEEI